jgi:hypothetical protein
MPSRVWSSPRTSPALDADPVARTDYDRLSYGRKREHVLAIESAKKAETRIRRIEKALAMLRDQESAVGRTATASTVASRRLQIAWFGTVVDRGDPT